MPTNCSAAKQLPQFYKHSQSADLLRKSILSYIWRVPSSKALSCKHEQLFDLLTLVSLIIAFLEKQASKKDRLKTNLRCDERKLPVRMDVSALQPDKIFDKISEAAPNNKE